MNNLQQVMVGAIMKEPGEAVHWFAYADWLEEKGFATLAAGYRWLGRNGKHPYQRTSAHRVVPQRHGWAWFCEGLVKPSRRWDCPASAQLPPCMFVLMSRCGASQRCFDSWGAATGAVIEAISEMRKVLNDAG